MLPMERAIWVLAIVLAGTIGFIVGQKTLPDTPPSVAVDVVSENTDVSNEINKSFGWAKAPENINVEAVQAFKGTRPGGDEYPHPMPAVTLALKNIGDSDLDSFGVNVLILDEQNKRRIACYGQASGSINTGWTSDKMLFDATETDWRDVVGTGRIDFPVTMVIYVDTSSGEKNILRVIFDPSELDELPTLTH
jgi:hypothetical protein